MRRSSLEWRLHRRRHGNIAIDTDREYSVETLNDHQIRRILLMWRDREGRKQGERDIHEGERKMKREVKDEGKG